MIRGKAISALHLYHWQQLFRYELLCLLLSNLLLIDCLSWGHYATQNTGMTHGVTENSSPNSQKMLLNAVNFCCYVTKWYIIIASCNWCANMVRHGKGILVFDFCRVYPSVQLRKNYSELLMCHSIGSNPTFQFFILSIRLESFVFKCIMPRWQTCNNLWFLGVA